MRRASSAELKLDLVAQVEAGRPCRKLPGIGADLAGKIEEFAHSGHLALLDRLRRQIPSGVAEMLRCRGWGPSGCARCTRSCT